MLEIAIVVALFLAIWTGTVVGTRRAGSAVGKIAVLIVGVVMTLATGKGLYELVGSRSFQLFGEMVTRIETTEPVIALTFDDGPSTKYTEPVLEILQDENVRATFFVTGSESSRNTADLRRIIAAGHEVGNHTWSHPRMLLRSMSFVRSEVERTDDAIRAAGYEGPIHFRSPYGKRFVTLPWYLRQTGRKNIFWDVEPETWSEVAGSPDGIVDHVVERARPGSIVLLHVMYPARETSRQALPRLIEELRGRGFRFVTVSELIEMETADR